VAISAAVIRAQKASMSPMIANKSVTPNSHKEMVHRIALLVNIGKSGGELRF
jgi:hypothetical protein